MGSREFTAWKAYSRFAGPLGPGQYYLGVGVIAAAIYNSKRTKNDQPMLNAEDFVPIFRETAEQTAARQQQQVGAFVANLGLNKRRSRSSTMQPKE